MYAQLKAFVGKIKGWRTYIVAGLVAFASGAVEFADAVGVIDLAAILPAKYAPYGTFLTAALMFFLRKITSTPPGKKA